MTKLEKNRKLTEEYVTRPVIKLLARTPITPKHADMARLPDFGRRGGAGSHR